MTRTMHTITGASDSPVVIHVPHAKRGIPSDVRSSLHLNSEELELELDHMTDSSTDVIAGMAHDLMDQKPWVAVHANSRLVCDPERLPSDEEQMERVGMGAVYTKTHDQKPLRTPTPEDRSALIRTYFDPYAAAFTQLVDERLAATGRCCIIDLHSYPKVPLPYELDPDATRPELCIGVDDFHTPSELIKAATEAGLETAINTPFAGCYVPIKHYRKSPHVASVMLEVRRDMYMGAPPLSAQSFRPEGHHRVARLVANVAKAGTMMRQEEWTA